MSESCLIDEGGTPYTIGSSHRFSRTDVARLARYAATSGVAFAVSETTLLILYGLDLTTATVAALIASLAGTVPSYLLSRYWIWREAARERALRQVILYWIVSISCIALTSLLTGALASLAPAGHPFHLLVVAVGYPIVMLTFWLIKFVIYQQIIFANAHASRDPEDGRTPPRQRAPAASPGVRGPTGRQAKTQLRPQHRENGSGSLDRPFPML